MKMNSARWFLRVLGITFTLIMTYLLFSDPTHLLGITICGALGLSFLLIGQFGSQKLVNFFEKILTGW
jgi:hypothetical protein